MGWTSPADETYAHEGYALGLLDGREPEKHPQTWYVYDGMHGHPRVTHLQAACDCGWRGDDTYEIDWDADADANEGDWNYPGRPYDDWRRHIAEVTADVVPADVEELLNTVGQRLGELAADRPLAALSVAARLEKLADWAAVTAAVAGRRQGHTWEAIGAELGATRQAAFQRFARHLPAADAPYEAGATR